MTDEPESRREKALRANAALDGELDAANALRFERDLKGDVELQRLFTEARAAHEGVRRHAPREEAPTALRARVLGLVEPHVVARRRPAPPRLWLALAASLAVLAFVGGFVGGQRFAGPGRDEQLEALVDGFARGQVSGQPFDVASSDRHTVKPWLASRAPFGSVVVDLADLGFPLAGGRIDVVDRALIPTLVYRRREHFISVSELPLNAARRAGAASLDGYHIERWSDPERAYVAISDLDAADLAAFAEDFRRRAEATAQAPGDKP